MQTLRMLINLTVFVNLDNGAKLQETNYIICEFWLFPRAFIFNAFFDNFEFLKKMQKVKV